MNSDSSREKAIKNMGGLVWLYEKHLANFKSNYSSSAIHALEYLLEGRPVEARILVHSVKGLSGTLGLDRLYSAASDLEKAIIELLPAESRHLSAISPESSAAVCRLICAISYYQMCLDEVTSNQDT